jgi:Flp pilus assembly protein TadD
MKKATSGAQHLDPHTALLAWMRLGQLYDMKGRRNEAVSAYKQAIAVAPQSDVAKESKQYLSTPYRRT